MCIFILGWPCAEVLINIVYTAK